MDDVIVLYMLQVQRCCLLLESVVVLLFSLDLSREESLLSRLATLLATNLHTYTVQCEIRRRLFAQDV